MQAAGSFGSFLQVYSWELMPPVDMLDLHKKVVDDLPCVRGNDHGIETRLFSKEVGFDERVGCKDDKVWPFRAKRV